MPLLHAQPRDLEQARRIGAEFLSQKGVELRTTRGGALNLALTSNGGTRQTRSSTAPLWYLFNTAEHEKPAFVLVAAEGDEETAVLGYSTEGRFSAEGIPPHISAWLEEYTVAQSALREGKRLERGVRDEAPIEPLLANIQWDQVGPYNKFTPTWNDGTPTPVGCVATAMGQIMRYHSWPAKGRGFIQYTPKGMNLEIKQYLGVHEYKWDIMPGQLTPSTTPEEQEAVARLLYEVGIAAQMNYRPAENGGSGALSRDMAAAMFENFDYARTIKWILRSFYTRSQWENIILDELKAHRPVYYAGSGAGGGHAFVCDGYDGNGLFHFNWGWSGMSNGYFSLSALAPGGLGTGGGTGGFTNWQEIIIGLQPSQGVNDPLMPLFRLRALNAAKSKIDQSETLDVDIIYLISQTPVPFDAEIALAAWDSQGGIAKFEPVTKIKQVQIDKGATSVDLHEFGIFPRIDFRGLAEGNYTVTVLVREENGGEDWYRPLMYRMIPGEINAEVRNDSVFFTNYQHGYPANLEVQLLTTDLPKETPTQMRLKIKNTGEIDYSNLFAVADNDYLRRPFFSDMIYIPAGEELEVGFTVYLTKEKVYYDWDLKNSGDWVTHRKLFAPGDNDEIPFVTVNLLSAEALGATPSCTLAIANSEVEQLRPLRFNVKLSVPDNTAAFGDQLFYKVTQDGENVQEPSVLRSYTYVSFDKPFEEDFSFEVPSFDPGTYALVVGTYDEGSADKMKAFDGISTAKFTVLPNAEAKLPKWDRETSVSTRKALRLSAGPNPCADFIRIALDVAEGEYATVEIFSTTGKLLLAQPHRGPEEFVVPLTSLPEGIYILRASTSTGVAHTTFVKEGQ